MSESATEFEQEFRGSGTSEESVAGGSSNESEAGRRRRGQSLDLKKMADWTMGIEGWLSVTSVLALGVVLLLTYWIWKSMELFKTFERMGLPGPPPDMLTGNGREIMKKGSCEVFVEWDKKYGKCYGVYISGRPAVVVSDPEMLRDLMVKKFVHFPNRASQKWLQYKPWTDMLLLLKDDHWKHVRSQLSPTFSSGKLKKMMPAINRVIQNLLNYVKEKAQTAETVEVRNMASSFAMDTIAGAAFGMHVDSLAHPEEPFFVNGLKLMKLNRWLFAVTIQFPSLTPLLQRMGLTVIPAKPAKFFEDIMDSALRERRKDQQSRSDYLQLLVDAEKEGGNKGPVDAEIDHSAELTTSGHWTRKGLIDDEMKANAMLFFNAGFDTVATTLSFTLYHLAANPEAMKKAQDEVDEKLGSTPVGYDTASDLTYLDMCVNEAIRLNPPGFLIDREAVNDVEIGGCQVKKGTRMLIPAYSIHRNPNYWPDPEKFLPERHSPEAKATRHPFAFLGFGHGPRNCIGMRLAQLEIRMAIASILQGYTPVLCDKSVYPPVIEGAQIRMIAKDGMWVQFKPRD